MALSAAAAQRRSTSGRDAPGWPDETLTSSIERLVVSFGESSTGGFGLRGSSFFLRGVSSQDERLGIAISPTMKAEGHARISQNPSSVSKENG